MANISVRKDNENRPQAPAMAERDPARLMRSLLSWDPFREMAPFMADERAGFMPDFEVKETKDGYLFKADVPGIKKEDFDVNITGNRLTVSGKRDAEKQEKTDTYYTYERSYGSFTRAFTLPEGIDANGIHADLRDGVLTLNVPKKPEMQPKKIAVKTPETTPKG
jgi:HSP20 family protein